MERSKDLEQWKEFSARHGHSLEHYLELYAEAERLRCLHVVLANQPRKAPFVAPALAWLGRRLVIWGRPVARTLRRCLG